MTNIRIEVEDFEPGMTVTVKLDNEEYVIELDGDDPDPGEEHPGGEEPVITSIDSRKFNFGGIR